MNISLTQLRRTPKPALDRVRSGEEVVITEDGIPVFRIVPVDRPMRLEELAKDGLVRLPLQAPDWAAFRAQVNNGGVTPE
jgi:prevent-host-death family protein